jgi:hypothetical protein
LGNAAGAADRIAGVLGLAGTGSLAVVAPSLMRGMAYVVASLGAGASRPFAVPMTAGNDPGDVHATDHGGPRQLATLSRPRVR